MAFNLEAASGFPLRPMWPRNPKDGGKSRNDEGGKEEKGEGEEKPAELDMLTTLAPGLRIKRVNREMEFI